MKLLRYSIRPSLQGKVLVFITRRIQVVATFAFLREMTTGKNDVVVKSAKCLLGDGNIYMKSFCKNLNGSKRTK